MSEPETKADREARYLGELKQIFEFCQQPCEDPIEVNIEERVDGQGLHDLHITTKIGKFSDGRISCLPFPSAAARLRGSAARCAQHYERWLRAKF
jgi:hypothetical protein